MRRTETTTRAVTLRPHHVPARVLLGSIAIGILAGCAGRVPRLPEPLREPKPEAAAPEATPESTGSRTRPRVEVADGQPDAKPAEPAAPEQVVVPPIAVKKPISLVLDGVPLSSFINVVFGTELGFALQIDQAVRARNDLVSLRLTEPHPPEELYKIAVEVLRNYGVRVTPMGGMLQFTSTAKSSASSGLVTTRSVADVPMGGRVFVAVPLEASEPGRVAAVVRGLIGDQVKVTEMIEANAILLSGPGDLVQVAMDAALKLDAPAVGRKQTLRINPQFLPVEVLAKELRDVLAAEGFSVRTQGSAGVLTFVPVASANSLIIVSESEPAIQAAKEWAEQLDQPSDQAGGNGVYMYSARHTTVQSMLPILQAMVGGGASTGAPAARAGGAAAADLAGSPQSAGGATSFSGPGGQVAIDPVRNVVVFQGDAQRWRAVQDVLSRLDTPARQVVIEVTVAEVTLTDELSHGIEWALRNIGVDGMNGPLTALGGASQPAGALVWRALSSSGQVRALVNLFARDGRVSILSTPRLLVKSGETASIDVGTEVPIVTSQATAPDLPVTNQPSILQTIQYRKTGVLLDINAVVHSGQRVDLKLTQEVSEATQTDTSAISSPSIFSRRLQTSLTLADGQSMLLGGLMSSSKSDAKTKVPLIGDLPVVGNLFSNRRRNGTRTELLMLITPYVVEDTDQGKEITEAAKARFGENQRTFLGQPLPPPRPKKQ